MREKLTRMELDVLDILVNGRTVWSDTGEPIAWGAALSEIIERLKARKLVTYPAVTATEAGRAALNEARDAE